MSQFKSTTAPHVCAALLACVLMLSCHGEEQKSSEERSTAAAPSTTTSPARVPTSRASGDVRLYSATDATFREMVLTQTQPVLVEFWAEWAGPSRQFRPIVDAVARDYAGVLRVVRVNVDENEQLAKDYSVQGIPQLSLFIGGKLVGSQTGLVDRDSITRFLQTHGVRAPQQ